MCVLAFVECDAAGRTRPDIVCLGGGPCRHDPASGKTPGGAPAAEDEKTTKRALPVTPGEEKPIRAALKAGAKSWTIARQFRVSRAQVEKIMGGPQQRKSWALPPSASWRRTVTPERGAVSRKRPLVGGQDRRGLNGGVDGRPPASGSTFQDGRGTRVSWKQGVQDAADDRGDGSDAGQASQGLIVSSSQSVMRFCEQRGEDDPADAGKRAQDFHVTLPLHSRRFVRGRRRSGQRRDQAVDLPIRPGQLLADDDHLLEYHLEMSDSGLGRAGGNGDGRLAQCEKHGLGIDASNPMAFQETGDGFDADTPRLVGSRGKAPEVANPGLGEIAFGLQELRIVAPELLAGPVHESGPVTGKVVRNSRPLAQLNDLRGGRVQDPRVLVRTCETTGAAVSPCLRNERPAW